MSLWSFQGAREASSALENPEMAGAEAPTGPVSQNSTACSRSPPLRVVSDAPRSTYSRRAVLHRTSDRRCKHRTIEHHRVDARERRPERGTTASGAWSSGIPRKEVIQPHLPVRLPCYDFTPIIDPTFDGCLLAVSPPASGVADFRGVTGGVYKARERIHRDVADSRLLATPPSWRRVSASNPNRDRLFGIRSTSRFCSPLYRPM